MAAKVVLTFKEPIISVDGPTPKHKDGREVMGLTTSRAPSPSAERIPTPQPIIQSLAPSSLKDRVAHDVNGNFIPGAFFETMTTLSLLDHPGKAGELVDKYAYSFMEILEKVYSDEEFGKTPIHISNGKGGFHTLRSYFDTTVLAPLSPASDQIGRCLDMNLKNIWLAGEGAKWVSDRLSIPSNSENYDFTVMLTKMRAFTGLNEIVRDLSVWDSQTKAPKSPEDFALAAKLLGISQGALAQKKNRMDTTTRHKDFDAPATRARKEREPLIQGKPITTSFPGLKVLPADASHFGLGFGEIYHSNMIAFSRTATKEEREEAIRTWQAYEKLEENRQGLPRKDQDMIQDPSRPGPIGKSTIENIPPEFEALGAREQLEKHQFDHGSGLDRWIPCGSYAKECLKQDLPISGSQSGGNVNLLYGFDLLSGEDGSVYGEKDTLGLGLMISAFMSFGAYHSYAETFRISESVAANETFDVHVTDRDQDLYVRMYEAALDYTPKAAEEMEKNWDAYYRASMNIYDQQTRKLKEQTSA